MQVSRVPARLLFYSHVYDSISLVFLHARDPFVLVWVVKIGIVVQSWYCHERWP